VVKAFERVVLDLPDPLRGDVEGAPNFVQGPRLLATQAVAELNDATRAIGQSVERAPQRVLGEDVGDAVIRRLDPFVGDDVPKL